MFRFLGWGSGVLALLVLTGLAEGQKKGGQPKIQITQGTPQEYVQLQKIPEVVGKLAYVDTNGKALTLDIEYQYPVPAKGNYKNPNVRNRNRPAGYRPNTRYTGGGGRMPTINMGNIQNQMNNLMRQQQQLMTIKNPVQRMQRAQQIMLQWQKLQMQIAMQEMQAQTQMENFLMRQQMNMINQANRGSLYPAGFNPNALNQNFKLVTAAKEFELEATDTMIVRRLTLPIEYDDKGNVKKYTKDELETLRGKDKSKPGYEAKYEDLQVGQVVKIYILKPKKADKNNPDKNDKGDAKEAKIPAKGEKKGIKVGEEGGDDPGFTRPQVRMILIMAESNTPDQPLARPPNPKKNKKN